MKNAIKFLSSIFSIIRNPLVFLVFVVFFFAQNGNAQTNVSNITALQNAINRANAGDIITLSDGTFTDAAITIPSGKNSITVKALNSGKVIFNGTSTCSISGSNVIFSGFQYKNGNIGTSNIIELIGNNNTVTQCNFYGVVAHNYLHFANTGHNNTVTYSNFENKPPNPDGSTLVPGCDNKVSATCGNAGPSIQVSTSVSFISYSTISHCTFLNFSGNGGDFGNEAIRIGLGSEQTNTSGSVVEYCYFENTGPGDSEAISVKSRYNVLRYNTNRNNPGASFCFRTGNNNTAYSNFFINSGGIRIKEGINHMVYNNYFEGTASNSSLELRSDGTIQPNTLYIYHNTFYNPAAILLNTGGGTNVPLNVKFVNNIFQKSSGSIFTDSNTNVSFVNNINYGAASLGRALNTAEFSYSNPALAINSANFYGLTAASTPAFTSNGTYTSLEDNPYIDDDPNLLLDIKGQNRPLNSTQKNIGCDQYAATGNATNHPLVRTEAGPSYIATALENVKFSYENKIDVIVFPNPVNNSLFFQFVNGEPNIKSIILNNISGKTVLVSNKIDTKAGLDITSLTKGIYFIRFMDDQNKLICTKKIIKN